MSLLPETRFVLGDKEKLVRSIDCGSGLQTLDPLSQPNWDDLIADHPAASFFHGRAWAAALCQTYPYTALYLGNIDQGKLTRLIPLMEVNSFLTGRRGVCLPFTDFCPLLCEDSAQEESLWKMAVEYGRQRNWQYLEGRGLNDMPENAMPSLTFWGHSLELTSNEESLFSNFESSVRRAIRKAQKSEIEVKIQSDEAALRTYYRLHCLTRKRQGLPPQPFRFFLNLFNEVISTGMGFITIARHYLKPIAAAVFFKFGRKVIYKYGASDLRVQHLRANTLVMWESIKHACRQGMTELDFGRTSLHNEGLRRFKLGFGAHEREIQYSRYDYRQEGYVTTQDKAHDWKTTLYRFVPIFLSKALGRMLYPHAS